MCRVPVCIRRNSVFAYLINASIMSTRFSSLYTFTGFTLGKRGCGHKKEIGSFSISFYDLWSAATTTFILHFSCFSVNILLSNFWCVIRPQKTHICFQIKSSHIFDGIFMSFAWHRWARRQPSIVRGEPTAVKTTEREKVTWKITEIRWIRVINLVKMLLKR